MGSTDATLSMNAYRHNQPEEASRVRDTTNSECYSEP